MAAVAAAISSTPNATLLSKFHVEAIQSVVPTNPTDPRTSSAVLLPNNPATVLRRRFHALLCYTHSWDHNSGWSAAGWIKESLGMALMDQPLIAGRMRHRVQGRHSGDFEIVSNDSGARLLEARADLKLSEFLQLKENLGHFGSELVFWEDVAANDDQNPQFSPLFYVQVTNFTCGGYSIGISCSFLLKDPFVLTSFIRRWADIHNSIIPTSDASKLPTFYLPGIGKSSSSSSTTQPLTMGSNVSKTIAQSVVFKIPTNIANLDNVARDLALLCIEKAESEIGETMGSEFSLFVKGVSGEVDTKVEICSRQGGFESLDNIDGLIKNCVRTSWNDELGVDGVCFNGGEKPAYATSWINAITDHGTVIILPTTDGTKIIIVFN